MVLMGADHRGLGQSWVVSGGLGLLLAQPRVLGGLTVILFTPLEASVLPLHREGNRLGNVITVFTICDSVERTHLGSLHFPQVSVLDLNPWDLVSSSHGLVLVDANKPWETGTETRAEREERRAGLDWGELAHCGDRNR